METTRGGADETRENWASLFAFARAGRSGHEITRHGKPAGVLVSLDVWKKLCEVQAPQRVEPEARPGLDVVRAQGEVLDITQWGGGHIPLTHRGRLVAYLVPPEWFWATAPLTARGPDRGQEPGSPVRAGCT